MPYDTPYNQMIAQKRENSNRAYSDINAYSNQMANGRGMFDEARVRFPDRDGTTHFDTAQIVNPDDTPRRVHYNGGITHRNLEGSGGVLGNTFRGIGYGVDAKMADYHRRFCTPPRPQTGSGKYKDTESDSGSCSESDGASDMEGEGIFDTLVSGAKSLGANVLADPGKYINMAKQGYNTGKQAYDFAKPLFNKGKGMSGSAQNMSLTIHPFESPQEQAVFKNYESTSGPIGGAEPPSPPRMTKMTQALVRPEPRRPNAPAAAAEPPPKKAKEGGKRPPSAWIIHLKKFAAAKGISYRDAIRSPEAKSSYHSSKKGKGISGGSVIGGPSNDPVNRGKITGGGRKKKTGSALFAPRGEFPLTQKTSNAAPDVAMSGGAASTEFPQKYMKTTGHKWEGATLGAGVPKKRGGADKAAKPAMSPKSMERAMSRLGIAPPPISPLTRQPAMRRQTVSVDTSAAPYVGPNPPSDTLYEAMTDVLPLKMGKVNPPPVPPKQSELPPRIQKTPPKRDIEERGYGKRKGKGAMGYPIVTPARIRAVRQKTGGMLKQLMKSSSISGGAASPAGYPANANIKGFGKRIRRTPEHKALLIAQLMEKHKIPKTKAAKMLSAMSPLEGKGAFGDLFTKMNK